MKMFKTPGGLKYEDEAPRDKKDVECTLTAQELWPSLQEAARQALIKSDVTVLRCFESGIPAPASWIQYRASLRAIVGAPTGDGSSPLPAQPEFPDNA